MADTTYTLHTNAPSEVVNTLASRGNSAMWSNAQWQNTDGGVPDCWYGWNHPQRTPRCERHIFVPNIDLGDAIAMAKELIANGYQVIITGSEDWTDVLYNADTTPIYYRADHIH